MIAPASLSILTSTFAEGAARNRAVGVWSAMGAAGGSAGVLLGGILTDAAQLALDPVHQRPDRADRRRSDRSTTSPRAAIPSALELRPRRRVTATAGLSLLVFGIVRTDVDRLGCPVDTRR